MRYPFYTLDVFTDRAFGGNPLAVLPDARGLDAEQMLQIAREFNLSETAFVFPPEERDHTRRARIFTPTSELPFAGHPTVGTAFLLASLGEVDLQGDTTTIVLEEKVGPVSVTIQAERGEPVSATLSAAKLPEFGPPPPSLEAIAETLSLKPADLLTGESSPQAVSCGNPFLFVPVRDRSVLTRIRVNPTAWERHLAPYWAPKPYIFTYDAELPGSTVRARMFSPSIGLREDPATGAAAAALAGYLGVRDPRPEGTLRWQVEQGFEMGRPSLLQVEADKARGEITAARVGGRCVRVSEGTIEVPHTSVVLADQRWFEIDAQIT